MFKRRIIGAIVVADGWAVQTHNFSRVLPLGRPEIIAEFLNQWAIDEIALVNISEDRSRSGPAYELIGRVARTCLVPLTYGGGIRSVTDMRTVLSAGADKVLLNTSILSTPSLIEEGAAVFGRQAIIVSLDCRFMDGEYRVFTNRGKVASDREVTILAREYERRGAGEILVRSIERDGSGNGYDLTLVDLVAKSVAIPVIAAGGVGHPEHVLKAIHETRAGGFAIGNYLNYTEHSVITMKRYLAERRDDIRLDTYANYEGITFDSDGRIQKKTDADLLRLRFTHVEEEEI